MLHYMSYGAVVGALGGFLGGLLGNWAAGPLVEFFRVYFNMPDVSAPVSMKYLIFGTLLAFVFCSLVAGRCARGLGSLHPAEALRPEAPAAVRVSWLERIPGFLNLLTVPGVMAVRGLARNRRRSLFSILGIASAFMITASLVSMNTLMDAFIFDYLEKMQQQDLAVYFDIPISEQDALGAVKSREVELAEGIVEAPVTLRGLAGELDCTVRAIEPDAQLTRLYREDGSSVQVQEEGIVISEHQARRLGVSRGDILEVKLSYPEERISRVRITDTIAQYLGETVYMSKEGLARVSDYWNVCTAVLLKAPEQVQEELADNLRNSPLVTGIQTRSQLVDKYRGMMGSIEIMMGSMASMGVLIGLAVIYTSSLISYEELKRELCVMLMLGVRSRLCLDVIRVGQLLLTAAGIVIGIPMTLGVSSLMSSTMATETYSIPNFVDTRSVVLAIGLTFAAAALSSELILRKLKKITPAELLRERE